MGNVYISKDDSEEKDVEIDNLASAGGKLRHYHKGVKETLAMQRRAEKHICKLAFQKSKQKAPHILMGFLLISVMSQV